MSKRVIPTILQEAIAKFERWAERQLTAEQSRNAIDTPLYHYTDLRGLQGIIENQAIWFTDYRHLNDPSELTHGIDMAHDVMRGIGNGADELVRSFLEMLADLFSHRRFSETLEFHIASFSRDRDDLGQWRAYADNGRGYALGLAPRMFRVVERTPDHKPSENVFVGPVLYNVGDICARHTRAIEQAVSIFLDAVSANAELVKDAAVGIPFMKQLVKTLIASPLIWNCLTSKHSAYAHEQEVRLVILGTRDRLLPYITTRLRGGEIVPYIVHRMPIREPNSIAEIVVGPAAPPDAESSVRTMLNSLGVDPKVPIGRSDIPYRAWARKVVE
jgi:hypothetical protein